MKKIVILCVLLIQCLGAVSQAGDSGCNSDSHRIVAPFLGEWEEYEVTDSAEVYIGRLSTRLNADGCVLTQSFTSADSAFSYHSQGYVNPASNIWEETYVFNSGGYSKFLWIADGKSLYTLRVGGTRQMEYLYRLKYQTIEGDEYIVVAQQSHDGGKTWESKESTKIKRIE